MAHPRLEAGFRLVVRRGLHVLEEFALGSGVMRVGRSPDCEITLDHSSISRVHARLERQGIGWRVIDNGSTNGVLVNGRRVNQATLAAGDVVEIGPFCLNYLPAVERQRDQTIRLAGTDFASTTTWASGAPTVVKQRLEDLYGLARLLIRRERGGPFWQSIQSALERSLSADRCVFVGFEESGGLYRLTPQLGHLGAVETLDVSRSILRDVVNTRQGVLIERVVDHQRYAQAVSLVGRGVGSVICAPVMIDDRPRAIMYADRLQTRLPFQDQDLQFAMAAVDLATAAIELDDLHEKAQELARVHGRIEAAREIQELLLPSPLPQPPWGRIAAENVPAEQMSGDIYDVVCDRSGRLVTTLADVSGKGVPAAFLTAVLQSTLRAGLDGVDDLRAVLQRANQAITMHSPAGAFVTIVVCRWSADGRSVEIASAGHHPPLYVKRDGTVEAFPKRLGLPLGINEEWEGQVVSCDLDDVSTVLLYSDGVIEARNPDGEEYGSRRLCSILAECAAQDAEEILPTIASDVGRFRASHPVDDDLTLLVVRTAPV